MRLTTLIRRLSSVMARMGFVALSLVPVATHAQTSTLPSSVSSVPSSVSSLPAAALSVGLPVSITAKPGDEIVLPLTVSQGKGINSFAISILFDPNKVSYLKAEESQDTQGFKFIDGELDALGGLKERLIGGTSATAIEKDGEAILANITFQVKPTASGDLSFKLSNPLDDIANASLTDGTVSIGAAAVSPAPSTISSVPLPSSVSSISSIPTAPSTVSTFPTEATNIAPAAAAPDQLNETGPAGTLALLAFAGMIGVVLQRRRTV